MEIDSDLDSQLLQQFSCMGTEDKDTLVQQFQTLIGSKADKLLCSFYLDMNNWNLQQALGTYYDVEQSPTTLHGSLVCYDNQEEPVLCNSKFVRACVIANTGPDPWPPGCSIRRNGESVLEGRDHFMLPNLAFGQPYHIHLSITSPNHPCRATGEWRLVSPTGVFFGEPLILVATVIAKDPHFEFSQPIMNNETSDYAMDSTLNEMRDTSQSITVPHTDRIFIAPHLPTNVSGLSTSWPQSGYMQCMMEHSESQIPITESSTVTSQSPHISMECPSFDSHCLDTDIG